MSAHVTLQARVAQYLAERRHAGFELSSMGHGLKRFARYVESMQQALDRRRAAWATVSPARYRSFPDWPAQDRAIEVHLYDLRGLAAANLRLRQAWGQL